MSGRRLAITERQARTLLRAANAERGVIEVKVDGAVVRLIPEVLASKEDGDAPQVDRRPRGHL